LSTVADVTGSTYRPSVLGSGMAWPQIASWDRDTGQAFIRTWSAYVILPQDERGAAQWLDDHLDGLAAALAAVMFVDRIAPVMLAAGNGSMFAALVTGRSE
jgi:hypothetical protein